ncbi:MAG: SEC-C domain-containing protein [Syntrophales bacterium]|jgi:hypothetical protein|nr:SEC-C domain-containing protein [Syntrophales bacterium]MDY0044965.1 SEC-C metal-binding domain-containing protein [Syntrophales bacterium]
MKWYQSNKRFLAEERQSLGEKYPFLKIDIAPMGIRINEALVLREEAALVNGIYRLSIPDSQRYIDYRIAILLPDNYPRDFPRMYCNDEKLPIGNIDRHIMTDGSACLGVNAEISQKWRAKPRIVFFLDEIVAPFLVWQAYYDTHGQPPPWGQRSHYAKGIFEYYTELLHGEVDWNIKDFMELLARKNDPKGHEKCPCGSGRRLRECHAELIKHVRQQILWKDVQKDMFTIEKGK